MTLKGMYWVVFTCASPNLSFLLDKCPMFDSKDKAFALLNHYRDEFAVDGYVCGQYGVEPEHTCDDTTTLELTF